MGRKTRHEEEEEEEDHYEEEEEEEAPSQRKRKKIIVNKDEDTPKDLESIFHKKTTSFAYTDVHRAILQYLMTVKVVSHEEFEKIAKKLGSKLPLEKVLDQINEKLFIEEMNMQINAREMLEEKEKEKVWGIVNTRSDDVAKKSTPLDDWQLALFKCCLELLAKAEDGSFSLSEACDALKNTNVQGKSSKLVETTLIKLTSLGWLRQTKKNFFTAGRRCLLELSEVLKGFGATHCPISKQIIINTKPYKEWRAQQ